MYTLETDKLKLVSKRDRASIVWLNPGTRTIYKSAPKYLIDNEVHWLTVMQDTGYVPRPVERLDLELISMPYIRNELVTRPEKFMEHMESVLWWLGHHECRHGDLTEYSVLVKNNQPVIIDFGEARHLMSPLPDKRREGDRYWLKKTMEFLAYGRR